jgi:hypothetical protein
MDAGVFFIKPVFSKQASAPTKLAEFLGCGIPCLSNAGVGDMAEVFRDGDVGIAVKRFDQKEFDAAVEKLLVMSSDTNVKSRCVRVARKYFLLAHGVELYRSAYRSLSNGAGLS